MNPVNPDKRKKISDRINRINKISSAFPAERQKGLLYLR
jgi:hypothetical protein